MIPLFLSTRRFLLPLLVCFFAIAGTANAQSDYGDSTGEEVAIAFFHAGDTNPAFDKWARGSREYKRVAPARSAEWLEEEKQRLMRLWKNYDPDVNLINIRMNVTIDLKTTMQKDGKDAYWMKLTYNNGIPPYLPYEFQQYKFAVIPQKLETMMSQGLHKEQYDLIKNNFEGRDSGQAYLYLQLKPVKAYINQPYEIDNQEQWVLLTDVANMAMKSFRDNSLLWNYSAPWYVSPVTEELRDLYGEGEKNKVKPEPSIP